LQLFWTLVIVENIFNAHDVSLQAHFFWWYIGVNQG
jgi:hypothetical protein